MSNSCHPGSINGQGINGTKIVTISRKDLEQAHLYVLHNDDEVEFYVSKHMDLIKSLYPNKNQSWLTREHNRCFITWLKDHISKVFTEDPTLVSKRLRWLANGPSIHVVSYNRYLINWYTFSTSEHDDRSTRQNIGVTLVAQSMHISSAKDRNPIYTNMSYFGDIERIWELDYTKCFVSVFQCT